VNRQNYSFEKIAALPAYHWPAFAAWGTGFIVGGLSVKGYITLTTVSAFDSMIAAAFFYCILTSGHPSSSFNRKRHK
jgi:cytosine/uracil/thiamine/allantoin permease